MAPQITSLGAYGGPGLPLGLRSIAFMSDINFALQLAGPHELDFDPVSPVQSLQASDQGIRLIVQVINGAQAAVNIRAATTKTIKLMRPDGSTYDAAASLLSNGMDGKMYFLSSAVAPPYDEVGEWKVQAKVVIGGVAQSTQWSSFLVEPVIDAN